MMYLRCLENLWQLILESCALGAVSRFWYLVRWRCLYLFSFLKVLSSLYDESSPAPSELLQVRALLFTETDFSTVAASKLELVAPFVVDIATLDTIGHHLIIRANL
jgi:hypothetical protein